MGNNQRNNGVLQLSGDANPTGLPLHTVLGLRDDMDFFRNRYHNINRLLLMSIGLWPNNRRGLTLIQRIVFLLVVSSLMNVQLFKFFTTSITVDLVIEIIPHILFCAIAIVKYFFCWLHSEDIRHYLDEMKHEWYSVTDEKEIEILKRFAGEGKFYILLQATMCYVGTGLFLSLYYIPYVLDLILPLNESRPNTHPFVAEYFLDSDKYFLPILLHMQICIIFSMMLIVGSDAMVTTCLLHMCSIFNITGYRLRHLFDVVSNTNDADSRDIHAVFCARLARIIQSDRNLREYLKHLEGAFAWSYIIQMVMIVIAITGLLLELHRALSPIENMGLVLLCGTRVFGNFFVAFLNIIPAQRIVDCSSNLFIDAYTAKWYDAPLKSKKLLLIVMAGTIKPLRFSAGNLIFMSFEIYASIVRTTFSYFTMIYSMEN